LIADRHINRYLSKCINVSASPPSHKRNPQIQEKVQVIASKQSSGKQFAISPHKTQDLSVVYENKELVEIIKESEHKLQGKHLKQGLGNEDLNNSHNALFSDSDSRSLDGNQDAMQPCDQSSTCRRTTMPKKYEPISVREISPLKKPKYKGQSYMTGSRLLTQTNQETQMALQARKLDQDENVKIVLFKMDESHGTEGQEQGDNLKED